MINLCNRDCFNCKYDDCVVDNISSVERIEINTRDANSDTPPQYGRGHTNRRKRRALVFGSKKR